MPIRFKKLAAILFAAIVLCILLSLFDWTLEWRKIIPYFYHLSIMVCALQLVLVILMPFKRIKNPNIQNETKKSAKAEGNTSAILVFLIAVLYFACMYTNIDVVIPALFQSLSLFCSVLAVLIWGNCLANIFQLLKLNCRIRAQGKREE